MTTRQVHTEKINAELRDIRAEVQRLRALARRPRDDSQGRLENYIEELDEKRRALAKRVASLDDKDTESVNDVMRGLKEARDRLSIAREAARARFH
jgi:hypothetical protein